MSASRIGPYEVVRELGRGGMGVVLEVRRPDLPGCRLALKLISKDAAAGTALERFSREARLLARVKHPNVVGVHALASTEDGRPYLVTDLVEGTTLKQLARAAPFDPARAAEVLRALASAVSSLHAAGILHRDLKPENVILQADDTPVLLDFGLAREHDAQRLTQTGTVLGTPAYMSPEQAGGDSPDTIDARTDVYGLGAILFELLAGRPPFEGTPIQIVTAVLHKEPRWPSQDRGDVPAALEAVLRKAMAKEPAARYGSAAELGKDLARYAGGERVAAPRAAGGRSTSRALVALAALAVVVVLGVGGATSALHDDPPAPSAAPTAPVTTSRRAAPAPGPAFGPEPSSDPAAPVATYRRRLRWLDDPANEEHPARQRVERLLQASRERPLLSLACPDALQHQVIVRFLSDAQLVTLSYSPTVHVLDVDHGLALVPRWKADDAERLWHCASSPTTIVVSGRRDLRYARLAPTPARPEPLVPFGPFAAETRFEGAAGELRALAISPDGRRAAVGGQWPFVVLFDLEADPPRELRRLTGFRKEVMVCAFSPDGTKLVIGTASLPTAPGEVSLWSADGDPLGAGAEHVTPVPGSVSSISFAPRGAGSRFVVGSTFGVPNTNLGPELDMLKLVPLELDPGPQPVAFPLLAFGPGETLHGLTELRPTRLFEWRVAGDAVTLVRRLDHGDRHVASIAVPPDGTILALGGQLESGERGVELWAARGR